MRKKIRTRQHVIEDLSRNYIERFVLIQGHTLEIITHDYGYDLNLYTYNKDTGEIENGYSSIQLKATDNLFILNDKKTVCFSIDRRDLELWYYELYPVFLVVYDAKEDRAFWIYIQAYFNNLPSFDMRKVKNSITIHMDIVKDKLDIKSIDKIIKYKNRINYMSEGVISHDF
ncbi:hypothetical protein LF65_05654 [Clostridium beijerinckii]|uniref:DUF4365 domain-containing protein n=1 Tax=Clostridium beijerinckii TaxID=1520 RepID=A0A0B5QMU9_CLOBE|nr:DUF4365 domain-containing protein [Clostridium beijerinckii]AJH02161.1 hypothetical protein LF65_05654 [Clostridium beijerinckii]